MQPEIGNGSDVVTLELSGGPVLYAETYEVQLSVLTQPCAFGMRLSTGNKLSDLLKTVRAGIPFRLLIGGVPQFSGTVDGFTAEVDGRSGSYITIRGRDAMAAVHDAFITSEQSFADVTFRDLTQQVLTKCLGGRPFELATDAAAGRKVRTASPKPTTKASEQEKVEEVVGGSEVFAGPKTQQSTLRTKLGARWYDGFLKPELDRAGLFLWCAPDGTFVLSQLYPKQDPLYRIVRRRGITVDDSARGTSMVRKASWRNDATARYSRCDVHGRRGGGATARTNIVGSFVDDELEAWGIARPMSVDDDRAKTIAQAEFLARRKIAEARRAGWSLTYVVSGHTVECLQGGRAVWAPETVVEVEDDEFGIYGPHYIESVRHARDTETTTTLVLMRPDDVLFGEEEGE